MKLSTTGQIEGKVDVIDPRELSKEQRLERWALALERRRNERLRTLRGTEYEQGETLLRMRHDNSALTVAFEDPVLRSAGLKDDSYGAALGFFGLSHGGLHKIVCHCHFGDTMSAQEAAAVVRSVANTPSLGVTNKLMLCGVAAMLLASTAFAALS